MMPGVRMRPTQLQVQKGQCCARINCNLAQLQLPCKGRRKASSAINVYN